METSAPVGVQRRGTFPLLDLGIAALIVICNLPVYTVLGPILGPRAFDDSLFVEGLALVVVGTAMATWSPATKRRRDADKKGEQESSPARWPRLTAMGLRVVMIGIIVILVSVAIGELALP